MLLDEQSAVNCTLHIERVAFRCCLAAAGTWVDDSTCAFREAASSPGHPSNMMAKRLADWNKCLATESAGNDTLTDLIAAAGQVCFAAPGSTTEAQIALVSVLIVLGVLVALVVAVVAFCTCCVRSDGRSHPRQGDETAALKAGSSEDLELESTSLLTAVDSERGDDDWGKDNDRRRSLGDARKV